MNARFPVLVVALIGISIGCSDEIVLQGPSETGTTHGACSDGHTLCSASCVDTLVNSHHCGSCGNACAADHVCRSGECSCAADHSDCAGRCVDTLSDDDNCGECGERCAAGRTCVDGSCRPCTEASCECPDGQTPCIDSEAGTSSCENLESDPSNCGACGRECEGGQRCSAGVCSCSEDEESCDGDCVPAGSCNTTTTTGGSGGVTSTSNSGGEGGAPPTVSSTGSDDCSISIEDDLSDVIGTVGIVTFEAMNIDLTSAKIEFTRAGGGPTYVAPVDLDQPEYRTLLLGMKGDTEYEYRVILNDGECVSPVRTITTGPVSSSVPEITKYTPLPAAVQPGFVVTSGGLGAGAARTPAFILDSEGDVVWWAEAPSQCTRAKMDWEGKYMYMMALNLRPTPTGGEVRRVSMDGLEVETKLSGLEGGHHDFTVTPGGNVVAIVHQSGCSGVLERTPAGVITTIVDDVSTIYEPVSDCHPNSIHYHPEDESFTISDRNPNLFVKISRTGEPEWQFGGKNPKASVHYQATWLVNHGHQILPDGHFLFFNNGGATSRSAVREFDLTTPEATEVWSYENDYASPTLGDVERLPNGNTLISYSNAGVLQEIDNDKHLVQEFNSTSFGYVEHRSSLYGPPPR